MLIDGKRALAYVVTVDEVRPIQGYDRVEHTRTNGWWCVTKLGDLKVGDKAVYFEVDSKVPATDKRFEFLENKHFKIKTQKMCKVYSQGLLMPITLFPELADKQVGDDVTDILGITYSVEEDNARKANNVDPKAKYKSMASRHPKIFKSKFGKVIMKHEIGRRIMFLLFGKKKDKPLTFPNHFQYIHKTDEERCLIGDTKIQTDNGILRIADIVNKKLNVKVLSYNHNNQNLEYKSILDYQKFSNTENEDILEIKYPYKYGNTKVNTIRCTSDHRFYTNQGYIEARDLKQGDSIFIHHKCYSNEVFPLIFGMLLGDSSIILDRRSKSNNIRIDTAQGEKQLDYLKFKQRLFGKDYFKIYKCKSGYCDNIVYKGCLAMDYNISHIINETCYHNHKKTITKKMIDYLNPISLALWYMDDGNLKHKESKIHKPSIMISTCGFTLEENNLLIHMLKNKFGIDCNLRKDKKYWSIYITVSGTYKFLKLVTQYMPKSMRYKTLKELENEPFVLEETTFNKQEMLLPVPIIKISKYKGKRNYRHTYDLEVQDNHNFFANNILTHNCENIPWVLGYERPLIVTEKLDGTSSTYILERLGKNKFEFYVLSRNVRQKSENQKTYHDHNIYWDMAFKYDIENKLKEYLNENPELTYVCIQGESVGSVQGNPLKLKEDDLYVFNFIRSDKGRVDSLKGKEIIEKMGMKFVPILDTNYFVPTDMEEFKNFATAKSVVNPEVMREGVVLRDPTNDFSFKNVSREYLLKHNG